MRLPTSWFLALCVFGHHAAAETLVPRDNADPNPTGPADLSKRQTAMAAAAADCTTYLTRTVTIPPPGAVVVTTTILSFLASPCPFPGCDVKFVTKTVQAGGGGGGWGHPGQGAPPPRATTTTTTLTAFTC
jgi:hypothetical protein